jgi:phage tail tape-measure protein
VVFALVIGSGGYTAAKTVGKVAIKVIGVSTGATTGAMIGSVIPFAGTAVGGIIGGIVGWFTVDAAAIKVSEHFGRKDFEAELTALIDEQQAIVKSEFRKKVKDSMEEVMKASPEVIIGLGK